MLHLLVTALLAVQAAPSAPAQPVAAPPAAAPTAPANPPAATPPAAEPSKPAATLSPRARAKEIKEITGTIVTQAGEIGFRLEPTKAPLSCANFCNLVRRGFFTDRPWKMLTRVVRQAGTDFPAYALPREFSQDLFFDVGGRLAFSKTSDDAKAKAHGTRFFVTTKEQSRWNLDYPVFGVVTSGLPVVIDIKDGDSIKSITLTGDVDALLAAFAPEVEQWNRLLDVALKDEQTSPSLLPGDPAQRKGP